MIRLVNVKIYKIPKLFGEYKKIMDTELIVHGSYEPTELFKLLINLDNIQPNTSYRINICNVDEIPEFTKYYDIYVTEEKRVHEWCRPIIL